jgi:hypothetical protein
MTHLARAVKRSNNARDLGRIRRQFAPKRHVEIPDRIVVRYPLQRGTQVVVDYTPAHKVTRQTWGPYFVFGYRPDEEVYDLLSYSGTQIIQARRADVKLSDVPYARCQDLNDSFPCLLRRDHYGLFNTAHWNVDCFITDARWQVEAHIPRVTR